VLRDFCFDKEIGSIPMLEKRYISLTKRIENFFQRSLTLSTDVMDYINSTFSNPSANELEKIISGDSNCENDSLLELIFSPDELIQTQLEEILETHNFQKKDEKNIVECIISQEIETKINLPDKKGSLKSALPDSVVDQFISHLNIAKNLDQQLIDAINKFVSENCRNLVKVKLRNRRFDLTKNKISFICRLFEKMKDAKNEILESLDFILEFFNEKIDDADIFKSLIEKKKFYFKNIQRAEKIDRQLKKNNMETLILQGIRIPYINIDDARKKMVLIDRINRSVFGATDYFVNPLIDQEIIEFQPGNTSKNA